MSTSALQGAKVWDSSLGEFISQQHVDLAFLISSYDERFSLVYVPQRDQSAFGNTKPFAIRERRNDGSYQVVRELTTKEMLDPAEILSWMARGDIAKRGRATVFQEMELRRLAQEALDEKRHEEESLDRQEMLATLAGGGRDHKHFFRHNGKTFRR